METKDTSPANLWEVTNRLYSLHRRLDRFHIQLVKLMAELNDELFIVEKQIDEYHKASLGLLGLERTVSNRSDVSVDETSSPRQRPLSVQVESHT